MSLFKIAPVHTNTKSRRYQFPSDSRAAWLGRCFGTIFIVGITSDHAAFVIYFSALGDGYPNILIINIDNSIS